MKLQPFWDRVIVEAEEVPEQTASGLYIPPGAKERPMRGVVLSVGPGKLLQNGELAACPVQPGDTVLFGKFAGTKVIIDGKELLMFCADDLFAKVLED